MTEPLDALGQGLIQSFEGRVLYPYDDADRVWPRRQLVFSAGAWRYADGTMCRGYPTIGWGRRIWSGESFGVITKEQANALFLVTLVPYVANVDKLMPGAPSPRRAAAASFAYNCGWVGLEHSGIPAAYREGRDPKAEWLAPKWQSSRGVHLDALEYRRKKEYALYMRDVPAVWTPSAEEIADVLACVHITAMEGIDPSFIDPGAVSGDEDPH